MNAFLQLEDIENPSKLLSCIVKEVVALPIAARLESPPAGNSSSANFFSQNRKMSTL